MLLLAIKQGGGEQMQWSSGQRRAHECNTSSSSTAPPTRQQPLLMRSCTLHVCLGHPPVATMREAPCRCAAFFQNICPCAIASTSAWHLPVATMMREAPCSWPHLSSLALEICTGHGTHMGQLANQEEQAPLCLMGGPRKSQKKAQLTT